MPKNAKNFRACGALRGSLIILRISESEIQMYRLLAYQIFAEMNVSLISMKKIVILLQNPLINAPKVKKNRACGALRWSLIILRIPESEIKMYRLLAFRKSAQISMYRLLTGGFIVNCVVF